MSLLVDLEGPPNASAATSVRVHLVAHGSPDPRHRQSVSRLAGRVGRATGRPVACSFLDHDLPRASDVLLARPISSPVHEIVLPLLLTAGTHWHRDLPPIVGHAGISRTLLPPLHPATFAPAVAELAHRDRQGRRILLVGAGSAHREAADRLRLLADAAQGECDRRGSGLAVSWVPAPAAVNPDSAAGAVVVPVLVADGALAGRIRAAAFRAGAATVTPVVGDTDPGARAIAAVIETATGCGSMETWRSLPLPSRSPDCRRSSGDASALSTT